jgi:hypothetical protein
MAENRRGGEQEDIGEGLEQGDCMRRKRIYIVRKDRS